MGSAEAINDWLVVAQKRLNSVFGAVPANDKSHDDAPQSNCVSEANQADLPNSHEKSATLIGTHADSASSPSVGSQNQSGNKVDTSASAGHSEHSVAPPSNQLCGLPVAEDSQSHQAAEQRESSAQQSFQDLGATNASYGDDFEDMGSDDEDASGTEDGSLGDD